MASVSGSVFAGAGKKDADYLRKVYDAEGKEIEVCMWPNALVMWVVTMVMVVSDANYYSK